MMALKINIPWRVILILSQSPCSISISIIIRDLIVWAVGSIIRSRLLLSRSCWLITILIIVIRILTNVRIQNLKIFRLTVCPIPITVVIWPSRLVRDIDTTTARWCSSVLYPINIQLWPEINSSRCKPIPLPASIIWYIGPFWILSLIRPIRWGLCSVHRPIILLLHNYRMYWMSRIRYSYPKVIRIWNLFILINSLSITSIRMSPKGVLSWRCWQVRLDQIIFPMQHW